jgi:hypothetical protein
MAQGSRKLAAGHDDQPALAANGADIKGVVAMREGFKPEGKVNFLAARIGSNLECTGGHFVGHGNQPALDAQSVN